MPFGLWDIGHNQFEFARWCEKTREHYKIIKVEVVTENEKRFSAVLQNLITTAGSTVIKTGFAYDYKPRQHIFYRNGWWEISAVTEITQDVNPQAMSFLGYGYNVQYVIEMKQVNTL